MSGPLRQVVYIYCGEGACPKSTAVLKSALTKHLCAKSHQIQTITPGDTIEGSWRQTASAYVIGGGYDLGFIKCLGYEGTQQIKDYVHAGGSYLGICAGSYFACGGIEFDKGGELEVCGERQLKFYPGWCIGPVFGPYDYDTNSGARPAKLSCNFLHLFGSLKGFTRPFSKTIYGYFNGGGFFIPRLQDYTKIYDQTDTPHKKIKRSNDTSENPRGDDRDSLSENPEADGEREETQLNETHVLCLVSTMNSESHHENHKRKYNDQHGGKSHQNGEISPENREKSHIIERNRSHHTESETEANDQQNDTKTCDVSAPPGVTILAKYDDVYLNPAAIVRCNVGKGTAVLSAIHIEYDSASLDENDQYFRPVKEAIESYDKDQSDCFKQMLLYLGLYVS
ncbi:hypothetical protein FSP39_016880 [Pinctada imbricata]|uniref:Biotin-protein ligase N-terminal domain-containing protein n=1 Tax=Pinctada imbricata TaxID=66713 RepID=A0AA89C7W8_PINIB|nr:hypothetical protein FSP39_016880 [Pinctada imbricata]